MGDHGTHGSKRATQIDVNDSVDTRISMNLRKNNANDGGAVEKIPSRGWPWGYMVAPGGLPGLGSRSCGLRAARASGERLSSVCLVLQFARTVQDMGGFGIRHCKLTRVDHFDVEHQPTLDLNIFASSLVVVLHNQ